MVDPFSEESDRIGLKLECLTIAGDDTGYLAQMIRKRNMITLRFSEEMSWARDRKDYRIGFRTMSHKKFQVSESLDCRWFNFQLFIPFPGGWVTKLMIREGTGGRTDGRAECFLSHIRQFHPVPGQAFLGVKWPPEYIVNAIKSLTVF
jgi:hypothetical protein